MSDNRVFILALPLMIAFPSLSGLLGLPLVVAAFCRTMERHEIIVVTASRSATAGHQDGSELMQG